MPDAKASPDPPRPELSMQSEPASVPPNQTQHAPQPETPFDEKFTMTEAAQQFRRIAHELVDWIADYLENPRRYPVSPNLNPGDLASRLPKSAPEQGEPLDRLVEDFHRLVLPAVTHWNHPRFLAYFPSSASMPGVLGEMLAATLNTNAIVWRSSPASTELEAVTLGWLRQWLGLPEEFFGILYDTASIGTVHAIASAREMVAPEAHDQGLPRGLVLYCSEHAHSSVEKGAITLGIGRQFVRKVPVDSQFRMRVDRLRQAIEADLGAGLKPFCVVATVGTTSFGAVDPVAQIADVAERYGLWLHIDAAYAGAAAILPELAWILEGASRAHSLVMNPHKWLFTPSDCTAYFTRRPDILRRAFTLVPEYLRTGHESLHINPMDYSLAMGRRFRSLKLWFVMRYYGRQGITELLRRHIQFARHIEQAVKEDSRFELIAPVHFGLVCFRFRGSNQDNLKIIERVNATGEAFLWHTELDGKVVIRFSIGNIGTTLEDVQQVWRLIQECSPLIQPAD